MMFGAEQARGQDRAPPGPCLTDRAACHLLLGRLHDPTPFRIR